MFKGEPGLSRVKTAKTSRRREQYPVIENTINFPQASKPTRRAPELVPKTRAQERLVMSLTCATTDITVTLGPAGTGKTYLVMQAAILALKNRQVDRLILTRPAVGVEDEKHGFLPGDLVSKMEPWTRPLLDVLREYYHPREIAQMIDDQVIEISPLAYMRGRTFKRSWIVADEMQNATPAQVKMLLSRIGQGSRIAITGDVEQADRSDADNGLRDLCQRLTDCPVKGMDLVVLSARDTQRHHLITSILDLYRE